MREVSCPRPIHTLQRLPISGVGAFERAADSRARGCVPEMMLKEETTCRRHGRVAPLWTSCMLLLSLVLSYETSADDISSRISSRGETGVG